MTVSTTSSVVSYIESAAPEYPVPFRFMSAEDLVVIRRSAGNDALLVLDSDFSVDGVDLEAGGSITRISDAVVGATLVITRATPEIQPTDYVANDRFPAESHERALDRQTLMIQEQSAIVRRSIRAPAGEDGFELPSKAKLLGAAHHVIGIDPTTGKPAVLDMGQQFKGDPGAGALAVGLFIAIAGLNIPLGTDLINSSGFSVRGVGSARYIYDPAVDAAYVAANPATSVRSANGRGFRLNEATVSVDACGALADGSDDAPAWRAAYDAANKMGGAIVALTPSKTYRLKSAVNVYDNTTLWGYSATVKIGREFAGINNPAIKNFTGPSFNAASTKTAGKNVKILGVTFDGEDLGIDNQLYANANMHGAIICMGTWYDGSGVDGFVMRDCTAKNWAGSGAMLWHCTDFDFTDNKFIDFFSNVSLSVGSGIDIHACNIGTIHKNRFSHTKLGKSWHGFVILDWTYGSSNITATENFIIGMNNGDGISCEGNLGANSNLSNGIFSKNTIIDCQGQGLGLDNCKSVAANDNTIANVYGPGILATGTGILEAKNNRISGCKLGGIVSRSATVNATVVANDISNIYYEDTNYRGHGVELVDFFLAAGVRYIVNDNQIADTDGCGAYVVCASGLVKGNQIANAGRHAQGGAATLRASIFSIKGVFVTGNHLIGTSNTQYAISGGANDFPSIKDNQLEGTFATAFYFIAYRGTGIYHGFSINIEDADYDARTNVFKGAYPGIPAGYWYRRDTMLDTSPTAATSPGSVVVSTPSNWKALPALAA